MFTVGREVRACAMAGGFRVFIACTVSEINSLAGKYLVALLAIPNGYAGAVELRHLRYFVAVAEEQNVTRAAERLHVSQPPLSRQIRDLEEELGIALFEHGAKAVRLTEAGRVFLNEARSVLQRADEAVRMAKAVDSGAKSISATHPHWRWIFCHER